MNLKYRTLLYTIILNCLFINSYGQEKKINFSDLDWQNTKETAIQKKQLIFFDAYTSWCGPCKLMDKKIFTDAEVSDFFNSNFVNIKIDMEEGEGLILAEEFEIIAYPTLLFYDPVKNKIISQKIGYQKKEELLDWAKSL